MVFLKNLTLRSQMVLGGILILLIPMIITGAVIFITSSRTLENISKTQLIQIAQSLSGMIRITLEKDLRIITGIANDPLVIQEAISGEYEITPKKITDMYQMLTTDYEGVALVDTDGIIRVDGVDETRIGISIAERNYFHIARQGKISVGTMVFSKATGRPVFVLCAPIMSSNGVFAGVVIGVVKADFLMRYISSIKLGATGYAFMVDRHGMAIAHPHQEFILKKNVLTEPGLESIGAKMVGQQTGAEEYTFEGNRKMVGFTPIKLAGWSIGVSQHKDEIMALAYTNRNFMLLISVIFIVLTILAVFFFSKTISTPVQTTLTTLNHAIDQATEAFIIVNRNRKVQFANPATAAVFDRSIQDLTGESFHLKGTSQADMEEVWSSVEKGAAWSGHITGNKKDGSSYIMDLTIKPILSKTGKINCYLAIGRDISTELILQERIQQSQKMEAIGTLAGGIAHDFNNILSAIFGFTELALNSLDDRDMLSRYLKEILSASKRARDLVNHILTFSRKSDADKKPMIPKYVIKEALELLRASLPSTIEIRESLTSSAAILGNPTQIHQMTMNLCTNAGYAMKNKGGVLEVNLDEISLDDSFLDQHPDLESGKHLRLKITDTGNGIPPEDVGRIFEPFFTTKPPGEGTGLGLSAVHGIAKSLNGVVTVSSEIGKGTVFTVYLPVYDTEIHQTDELINKDLPGGSERILLVDDEVSIIQSSNDQLTALGYKLLAFTQSESAWKAFYNNPDAFDMVITDYTMPHMTGIELAKKIKEVRPGIPVIICSGYLSFQEKFKELKSIEFLKKPFTLFDLAHTVRRVLDQIERT